MTPALAGALALCPIVKYETVFTRIEINKYATITDKPGTVPGLPLTTTLIRISAKLDRPPLSCTTESNVRLHSLLTLIYFAANLERASDTLQA